MKKMNVTKPITTLDGRPVIMSEADKTEFTVGRAIANALLVTKSKKFDAFKSYSLAKRFYEDTEVDVDDSDFTNLIEIIKEDQTYGNLVIGQIIEFLNQHK